MPQIVNDELIIKWRVQDVLDLAPGLTQEQAVQVLHQVARTYDATLGVTWDRIWYAIEYLFPGATDDDN